MELKNAAAACAVMEPVNVLRDQRETRNAAGELGQSDVRGVRVGSGDNLSSPVVEFPDELWVGRECLGRGERRRVEPAPQSAGSSKRGYAALGRDACPGQDGDVPATSDRAGRSGELAHKHGSLDLAAMRRVRGGLHLGERPPL